MTEGDMQPISVMKSKGLKDLIQYLQLEYKTLPRVKDKLALN